MVGMWVYPHNMLLSSREQAAGVRYISSGRQAGDIVAGSPMVIRYADLC